MKLLIDSFGSVNREGRVRKREGYWETPQASPLRYAIEGCCRNDSSSYSEVITFLIEAKANVDSTLDVEARYSSGVVKLNDIEAAARNCPSPALTALLDASGDFGPGCFKLKLYLDIAVASSNVEVVKVLLAHKADPNARSLVSKKLTVSCFQPTCLMINCSNKDKNGTADVEIIRSLIGANADVERLWYASSFVFWRHFFEFHCYLQLKI